MIPDRLWKGSAGCIGGPRDDRQERGKEMTLQDFFRENRRIALAFSGGVDSSYLLYAALREGAVVRAYYVKSAFQPEFEYEDALRLARELGADMRVLTPDVLVAPGVRENPADRCYFCKRAIFGSILEAAEKDGFFVLMDGTNASDDAADRPGMRALREMAVRSPLRECGLTKAEVRRLSKEGGLFTWDKPAYACLATRIPAGEEITEEKLARTEAAEDYLFSLGFTDFRVRLFHDCARIQIPEGQMERFLAAREEIVKELKKAYGAVLLDLEARGK